MGFNNSYCIIYSFKLTCCLHMPKENMMETLKWLCKNTRPICRGHMYKEGNNTFVAYTCGGQMSQGTTYPIAQMAFSHPWCLLPLLGSLGNFKIP